MESCQIKYLHDLARRSILNTFGVLSDEKMCVTCKLVSCWFKVSFFVALEDGLTGSAWGDWSLYTASPLRAEDAEDADEPPKPPPFDPATQANTWVFHQCVTRCRWRT